jgi:hypothetical protein
MIYIYTNACALPCAGLSILSISCAMDKCYPVKCCVVCVVVRCALWFPRACSCCFSMDCAFEPVGEFDVRLSIRSWVHPVVAAMPSLTRFPVFSCLCSAMIVGNPVWLSDLATMDSATMWLLSTPDEASAAGLVEVNWVTTIAGLQSPLVLVKAHGRESPRHGHRVLPPFSPVPFLTDLYVCTTSTQAFLWI